MPQERGDARGNTGRVASAAAAATPTRWWSVFAVPQLAE